MTITTTGGTLTIDGRTYRVDDVSIIGPEYQTFERQVPDEHWTATDQHRHEHRYWRRGSDPKADLELPTLERHVRHVDCDGVHIGGFLDDEPCEGYDEPYWLCIVCGDEVQPGSRRGSGRTKVRDAYCQVTTTVDPAELANANGTFAVAPFPAHHEGARLLWPAGAGQTLDVTGDVWETSTGQMTWSGRGPASMTQVWALSQREPAPAVQPPGRITLA